MLYFCHSFAHIVYIALLCLLCVLTPVLPGHININQSINQVSRMNGTDIRMFIMAGLVARGLQVSF